MSWMAIISGNMLNNIFDAFVKSPFCPISVIPAPVLRNSFAMEGGHAGIQEFLAVLDSRCSLSRTQCGAGVTGL